MKKSNKNHNQSKMPPITLVNKALEELGAKTINGKDKQYKQRLESISKSLLIGAHQTKEIIQSMLVKGVSINNVFEEYIPDVARLLGDYWVKSMLSFAQVTLATSRLQSIARELEPLYLGERHPQNLQTEVLIIAPKGEQHTFGAQMVARKFKKLGTSPYLSINNTLEEIMSIIGKQKFRLIGLSVADQKACEKDSEVDRILRAIRKLKIPIVAGGNLANSSARILKGLHIDLVTNDVAHALNYFNINFSAKRYHPESINV